MGGFVWVLLTRVRCAEEVKLGCGSAALPNGPRTVEVARQLWKVGNSEAPKRVHSLGGQYAYYT
jgi:hypothetical protein